MGIFGFGSLRDRFASSVSDIRTGEYAACFDVTPIVVNAIRNSKNEQEFAYAFRHRLENSREIRYLRAHPPYALCYTLDNRAPRAKRQTQLQRLVESRSLLARITSVSATANADNAFPGNPPMLAELGVTAVRSPLRIHQVVHRVREIIMSNYILTVPLTRHSKTIVEDKACRRSSCCWISDDDITAESNNVLSAKSEVDDETIGEDFSSSISPRTVSTKHLTPVTITPSASAIRNYECRPFAAACRVEFDYNEGEGEIKALNWLARYEKRDKLIMARDNDVYIYVLSKLQQPLSRSHSTHRSSFSATTTTTTTTALWSLTSRHDADNDGRYLVYHESSNGVFNCWTHLSTHYDRCWLLLLWLSICFGNDFTHGLLDKSVSTISYYYGMLEREFLRTVGTTAKLRPRLFASSQLSVRSTRNNTAAAIETTEALTSMRIDDGNNEESRRYRARKVSISSMSLSGHSSPTSWSSSLLHNDRAADRCEVSSPQSAIAPSSLYDDDDDDDDDDDEDSSDTENVLANALCQLQHVLRRSSSMPPSFHVNWRRRNDDDDDDDDDDGTVDSRNDSNNITTENNDAYSAKRRKFIDSASELSTVFTANDATGTVVPVAASSSDMLHDHTLRLWIARQLWSFFYIMELPSEFSKDQKFRYCPSMSINASFGKPYLSREAFIALDPHRVQSLTRSVIRYGI